MIRRASGQPAHRFAVSLQRMRSERKGTQTRKVVGKKVLTSDCPRTPRSAMLNSIVYSVRYFLSDFLSASTLQVRGGGRWLQIPILFYQRGGPVTDKKNDLKAFLLDLACTLLLQCVTGQVT